MQTPYEKITFVLTGIAYILFHLGWGPDIGTVALRTLDALLNTLAFEIGFTYLAVVFIRRTTGHRPPWDRILRIFFTIGILLGLVNGLYEMGKQEQRRKERQQVSSTRCVEGESRSGPWYWA